ncbi:putative IS1560 transposase [Mycobacterium canetti]|nr:putative IS1560 transposase [Mycobacterium canetti]
MIPGRMVLNWEDGLNALVAEGIEAIVFRTLAISAGCGSRCCPTRCADCPRNWPGWTHCWTIRRSSPRSCRSSTRAGAGRRRRWRSICS